MDGSSALTCADERAQPLQFAVVLGADDLGEEGIEHLQGGIGCRDRGYPVIVAERTTPQAVAERLAAADRSADVPSAVGGLASSSCSGLSSLPLARIS